MFQGEGGDVPRPIPTYQTLMRDVADDVDFAILNGDYRLRIDPPARADGDASFSIGKRSYGSAYGEKVFGLRTTWRQRGPATLVPK